VNKALICSILFIIVIALAFLEQGFVDNTLHTMLDKFDRVKESIALNETSVNNENTLQEFYDMKDFWDNREPRMCIFVDYNHISEVGKAISKLEIALIDNDSTQAKTELNVLIEVVYAFSHIISFNLKNLV